MLELHELIEIQEKGEGVICRRFGHEAPLQFKRILVITPGYDKMGNPDYTVGCIDRAGCMCHVSARWLERMPKEGEGVRSA